MLPTSLPYLLALAALLLTSCSETEGEAVGDTSPSLSSYGDAAEDSALPRPEHLLFSRPLSLVELGLPAKGSVINELLKKERIWVAGERYQPSEFKARSVPPRLAGKARLFRATPRIMPALSVRGPIEAFSNGRARELLEVTDGPVDPNSLDVGEMLIGTSGIYAMVEASAKRFGPVAVAYPTSASASLSKIMSAPPTVGQPPEVTELRVGGDTRRTLQLTSASRLGWKLNAEDAGAQVTFSFGLPKALPVIIDDSAVTFRNVTEALVTFEVVFLPKQGPPQTLWQRPVEGRRAGRRLEAKIGALPEDVEGGQLLLQTSAAEGTATNGVVPAFWSEIALRKPRPGDPPNVLVILLDTLRADHLGCYGYPRPTSPVLDELAAKGAVFENAWSSAPWTLPSHASLFSSLYMSEHGVWEKTHRLPESATTIAEVLRSEGYATSAFTASGYLRPEYGFVQGFDRFWFANNDPARTLNAAIDWIEGSVGPYFSFVHTYHVHSPHDPEGAARDALVRPYGGDLPESVHPPDYPWGRRKGPQLDPEDVRYISDLYDAEILEIDTLLGEMLDRLEAAGKLDNTLIIVTSDHGEEFQDHGHFEHGWSLYEEQLSVPLIVHYPGVFEGGLRIQYPTIGVDVAPTIAAIAGASIPDSWSGVALGTEAPETDRPIWVPYRQRESGEPATALLSGDQKYIYFPKASRPQDSSETQGLYDLTGDAEERNNLWESKGVDRRRWERAVRAYEAAYPLRHAPPEAKSDAALADQLKALGYGGD